MKLSNTSTKQKHKKKPVLNQKGQSFIEFIFLLLVLTTISTFLLAKFNGGIADYWQKIVQIVASPNPEAPITIEIR